MLTRFDELLNVDLAHEQVDDYIALKDACVTVFDTMQGIINDPVKQSLYGTTSPYMKGLLTIIREKFGRIELQTGKFTVRYAYPLKAELKTATPFAFKRALKTFYIDVLTPFQNVLKTAYLQQNLNPVTDTSPTTAQAGEFGIFTVKRHTNSYTNKTASAQRNTNASTNGETNNNDETAFSSFVSETDRTDEKRTTKNTATNTANTTANDTMTDHGDIYSGETLHNAEFLAKINEFLNTSPAFKKLYAAFGAALIPNPETYDLTETPCYAFPPEEWYFFS